MMKIEFNRQDLDNVLNEISSLIQHITVSSDTSARFSNPTLKPCYELMNCAQKGCLCYGKGPVRCWQITGTFCGAEKQGQFAKKYDSCINCEVFKTATSGVAYKIGEQFNNILYVMDKTNKELTKVNMELKSSQSQIIQQEKMATIGQIAAGVAHEINNPMGFISSNLSTLKKYTVRISEFITTLTEAVNSLSVGELPKELKEKRRQLKIDAILGDIPSLIEESLDGADRVTKIVRNLKSFSRLDESELKMVDLNECVEVTLNIVWNELKYKSTVKKDYGELPFTLCYPQQLNQVFLNLLVNAVQAIEKFGEITIKTWSNDGSNYVSISDTGKGIPEDLANTIFEPFLTTKEANKGTGLGLSITLDIVKKHNGDITVDSEVGKGTTFTVKIPVVQEK